MLLFDASIALLWKVDSLIDSRSNFERILRICMRLSSYKHILFSVIAWSLCIFFSHTTNRQYVNVFAVDVCLSFWNGHYHSLPKQA